MNAFKFISVLSSCHKNVALKAVLSLDGPSSLSKALYVHPSDSSTVAASLIANVSLTGKLEAACTLMVFHSGTVSIDQCPSASPPRTGDLLTMFTTPPIVFLPNNTPWVPFKTSTLSTSNKADKYCSPLAMGMPSIN